MPALRNLPAGLAIVLVLLSLAAATAPIAAPLRASQQPTETVFVASVRALDGPGSRATRNAGRLRFSQYAVTVPRSHHPGGVSAEFGVKAEAAFDGKAAFLRALLADARAAHGTREVTVLVHGFNTGFAASVRRAAQIAADFELPASMVLFAWPSGNRLDGYARDLERAAEARADLADLLRMLARSGVSRIVVVGYSLGAALAVDTLADLKAQDAAAVFGKLGGVALLSPDIPVDDFKRAMRRLGPASSKVVAYISRQDWALTLLADVTDQRLRLGSVLDAHELADIRMTLVDVSAAGASDFAGHYAVGGQPGIIAEINGMKKPDLIGFARLAAGGGIAGATVEQHGAVTHVILP